MPMNPRRAADVRELGFNDRIQVNGRAFDIQTEVVDRGALKVRSTVLEQGKVLYSMTIALSPEPDDGEQTALAVQEQHYVVVGMVRRGEVH